MTEINKSFYKNMNSVVYSAQDTLLKGGGGEEGIKMGKKLGVLKTFLPFFKTRKICGRGKNE